MNIKLEKFGVTLNSRQLGKEVFLAFSPLLNETKDNEEIIVDFEGVNTLSPSWGDEFLTPLCEKYKDKLILKKTANPSANATIEILEETNNLKFKNDM